ncbi:CAP domain-containing protein [Maribacter sp. 2307ULW6-5]|uniref:CAP domain-containing protein n=1 Tax=Maribacter sp. 2307ULW6-5 TaxID=3386275 RepID=UPI0039BD6DF9
MLKNILRLFLILFLFQACQKAEVEHFDPPTTFLFEVSSHRHNELEQALFDLINSHRESQGLQELIFDSTTYYFAGEHNRYMIAEGALSHAQFPERANQVAKRTGAVEVAENVSKDHTTIEKAFNSWAQSPGHRDNMLGDFTHSAVKITPNVNGDLYFTQLFFK